MTQNKTKKSDYHGDCKNENADALTQLLRVKDRTHMYVHGKALHPSAGARLYKQDLCVMVPRKRNTLLQLNRDVCAMVLQKGNGQASKYC